MAAGWWPLAAAGSAWALAAWLAWRRPDRRRLPARLGAITLAIGALLALWLRPTRTAPGGGVAVVLTPGARADSATRATAARARAVVALPGADRSIGPATPVAGVAAAGALLAGADTIVLAGHGLDAWDLARLPARPVRVIVSAPQEGVETAAWPARLALGEPLAVQGRVRGRAADTLRLRLRGPAGVEDSAVVTGDAAASFALSALPRAAGVSAWVLELAGDSAVIAADTLAVDVRTELPPRVLVIEAAPRFETRALRDWLAAQGGTVTVRSAVSRDRSRVASTVPATDSVPVASEIAAADLVILDGRSLVALPPPVRSRLRTEVAERGLGLLLRPDETLFRGDGISPAERAFFVPPGLVPAPQDARPQRRPRLPGLAPADVTPVDAEPFVLSAAPGSAALVLEGNGDLLAARYARGAGRLGVTLVAHPHQWLVRGEPRSHAAYWATVVSALARPAAARPAWGMTLPARVDAPVELRVDGRAATGAAIAAGPDGAADSLALVPLAGDSTRWGTSWWPRRPGLHRLVLAGADTAAVWVSAAGGWRAWAAAERREATARHAVPAPDGVPPRREAIAAGWWFALLLVAAGYLWWEQR